VNRDVIAATGGWYRLLTAPFLHLNLIHLISNGLILLLIGPRLERLIGRAWLAVIYFGSALGGALVTVSFQAANMTSVGASGAIVGLMAAAVVISFKLPLGSKSQRRLQMPALLPLVSLLLPFGSHTGAVHVDHWAHLGGAVTGGLLGLLILGVWSKDAKLPYLRSLAALLAVAFSIAALGSAEALAIQYIRHQDLFLSIPQNEIPLTKTEQIAAAPRLLAQYPNDPRSHAFAALGLLNQGSRVLAEAQLREAVRLAGRTFDQLSPTFSNYLGLLFVSVLLDNGHVAEARVQIQPLCKTPELQRQNPLFQQRLANLHMCEG
jgi:rhomboid protease GluP